MTYRFDAFSRDLTGLRSVVLDTNACVYFLNESEPWLTLVRAVLERASLGLLQIGIPIIVHMELLVGAFAEGSALERQRIDSFVERNPFIGLVEFGRDVMLTSAELRGRLGLKMADAIIVGSACRAGSDAVIGNDRRFHRLRENQSMRLVTAPQGSVPQYIHLDDYIDEEAQKD